MALEIFRDYDLTHSSTFQTKAAAERFVRVENEGELREALESAKAENLPVTILGGGSNTIFLSKVPGLVVKLDLRGFLLTRDEATGDTLLEVGAGETLDDVIDALLDAGVGGLENLAAVPGTVGGAVVQNAGAYGLEMAERIESVRVLRPDGSVVDYGVGDCDFGYRHSITTTSDSSGVAQSYMYLAWDVALRTHMCERGVVPRDQLYSIISVCGRLTGIPWMCAPFVNLLANGAKPPISFVPSFQKYIFLFFCCSRKIPKGVSCP